MDKKLLDKIENSLEITFYEWQREYLLNKPMYDFDLRITGRGTGKTLAWAIRQLFESDEPLDFRTETEVRRQCDWWSVGTTYEGLRHHPYIHWYRRYVIDIKDKLNAKGIKTREIIL